MPERHMARPVRALGPAPTRVYLECVLAQERCEPPPTVRALADATGMHYTVVQKLIQRLRAEGLLPAAPHPGAAGINRPRYRVVAHTPRDA